MADLDAVSAQLLAAAAEVDRLQEHFADDLGQLRAKNAELRGNMAKLESCRAECLAEIDRLNEQLTANAQELEQVSAGVAVYIVVCPLREVGPNAGQPDLVVGTLPVDIFVPGLNSK